MTDKMKRDMEGKRKWLIVMIVFAVLAVILNVVEQVVIWQGLELRILAEEIKGIFLWLCMPYVLAVSVYMLFRKKDGSNLVKNIILGIVCIVILVIALFRGLLYIFGDGDRSEKTLDTGVIEVTYYGYNESYTKYYLPVAFFCKKPIEGWNGEEAYLSEEPEEYFYSGDEGNAGQPEGETAEGTAEGTAEETAERTTEGAAEGNAEGVTQGIGESGEAHGKSGSSEDAEPPYTLSIENVDVDNLGEEYALTEQHVFRLVVVDAALGSRAYALIASMDGGNTWEVINSDPFNGTLGVSAGLKFMDENIGFAALSHNGGDEADLYRTEDGGKTFSQVVIPSGEREDFSDGSSYFPFDFPGMPYEEDGCYYLKAGQGADGDFNGGDAACRGLYKSTDMGKTWSYVEITEP